MASRKRSRRQKSQAGPQAGRPASPLLGFRYPLIVAAIAAPLFALYFYPYAENGAIAMAIQSYLAGYAKIVGTVLSIFDSHVVVNGDLIAGPMFSMRIIKTCDAMEVNILLVAALAGFPMPLRRRLAAVLASVFLLVLVNVIRICALYWLGAHAPTWFHRAHQTFAPLCMVVCATAIFLVAISRTPPRSSEDEVGSRILS